MTRDEILAKEPGPELDALVVEKVMGWQYSGEFDVYEFDPNERGKEDFEPSTDISAAWEVLEEVQERGVYITIESYADFYQAQPFRTNQALISAAVVSSPCAPEAICKAALLAVMGL